MKTGKKIDSMIQQFCELVVQNKWVLFDRAKYLCGSNGHPGWGKDRSSRSVDDGRLVDKGIDINIENEFLT